MLLDGQRTVYEAVQQAGVAPTLIVDAVLALLESGSLTERSPPDPARIEALQTQEQSEPLSFEEHMYRGRSLLKRREYTAAEESFRAALSVRPLDRVAQQNLRRVQQLQDPDHPSRYSWIRR